MLASLNAVNTESGLKAGNACCRSVLNVLSSVYKNFFFQFVIQKYEDRDKQEWNFAFCFLWV